MDEEPVLELTLTEDVLQPLFNASNSTCLKEALETLIEVSKTAVGRSDLASKNILCTVLRLSVSLLYPSGRELLILSLRLLRNLCAGEAANQKSFIEQNGVQIVATIFMSLCCSSDQDSGILRVGLQVLANVVLAGEEHQHVVWHHFFPDRFLVLARVHSQGTCDALCKIICTCCDENPELVSELHGNRGLTIVTEIVQTASEVGFEEHWLKSLLSRICFEGPFFALPSMFSKLHLTDASEDKEQAEVGNDPFSQKQAYALGIISDILNERITEITVPDNFASFVYEIFNKCVRVVQSVNISKSGLSMGSTTVDVLGYLLKILRDICSQDSPGGAEAQVCAVDMLLSSGLVELLLSLLRDLEPPAIIRKVYKQSENQETTSSCGTMSCPYKGFRRDIVAVIGNCAYRRKKVQDELRSLNGILLLLQQCVVDEDNPYLREWGIWCVRNLLEDNAENQKVVAELELQRSIDIPEISRLGLCVEVDQVTRRVKLANVS